MRVIAPSASIVGLEKQGAVLGNQQTVNFAMPADFDLPGEFQHGVFVAAVDAERADRDAIAQVRRSNT